MWFLIFRLADLHLALLWRVVRQPRGGDLIALLIFENLLLFHSRLPLLHFHLGGRNQTFNYLLTSEWARGHNVFLMKSSKPPLLVSSCLRCLVPFWAAWADTRLSPAAVWPEVSCWGHLEESDQRYMNVKFIFSDTTFTDYSPDKCIGALEDVQKLSIGSWAGEFWNITHWKLYNGSYGNLSNGNGINVLFYIQTKRSTCFVVRRCVWLKVYKQITSLMT